MAVVRPSRDWSLPPHVSHIFGLSSVSDHRRASKPHRALPHSRSSGVCKTANESHDHKRAMFHVKHALPVRGSPAFEWAGRTASGPSVRRQARFLRSGSLVRGGPSPPATTCSESAIAIFAASRTDLLCVRVRPRDRSSIDWPSHGHIWAEEHLGKSASGTIPGRGQAARRGDSPEERAGSRRLLPRRQG